MKVEGWLALAAGVLALVAIVLVVVVWRRQGRSQGRSRGASRPGAGTAPAVTRPRPDHVAFVANPAKPDTAVLRQRVLAACAARELPEPAWYETTPADPGTGQTRTALAAGADLVVAVGGDGTVRAVAQAMTGTGVPMGVVPLGTGNLLARNVDLPLTDPRAAIEVALSGRDRAVDVGRLRVHSWAPGAAGDPDHLFLVIAGLGFDAAMVAATDDQLKARVGWIAYFVGGIRHLHGSRLRVRLTLDDTEPQVARVRSVLVGNCGRLPGGITLLPDAVLDDGWLDLAAIDTRGGLAGWAQLFGEVMLQGAGIRTAFPAKIGRIDHARARRVRLEVSGGAIVQVDGDIVGEVTELSAWVEPGALLLRVP